MIAKSIRPFLILLVCFLFFATADSARADIGYAPDSKAVPIIIAVVAVGALIVFLVVHHHGQSLKGCVSTSPEGLHLQNQGDGQVYTLTGAVDGIKPGDRVRVSGKKKKDRANGREFIVRKLSKDYGACRV